jgi:CheY-like chemotaxis protein
MDSKNVLVLDSETETCLKITFLLKLAGCLVTTRKDAREVINLIETSQNTSQQFDLLLISNYTPYISNPKIFIEIIKSLLHKSFFVGISPWPRQGWPLFFQ